VLIFFLLLSSFSRCPVSSVCICFALCRHSLYRIRGSVRSHHRVTDSDTL
jgi:hypothetical protein